MPCTSEFGAGVGAPSTGAARSSRRRPAPKTVSAPGRADVERLRDEPVAHALRHAAGAAVGRDLAPTAARRRRRRAASAHEVPPQALTSSDSGSPGVMRTFVGAAMSGLRRPSSVGPSDEYDSGCSVVASNAPTENAPRRVAGRGGARGGDLRGRREVHAAVEGQVRRRRRPDAPDRRRSTARARRPRPAACRRAARAAPSSPWTGSAAPWSCRSAGVVSAGSVKSARRVVAVRIGGRARPREVAGGAAGRRQLERGTRCRRPARRGCRRRRRRSTGPPSAGCGSCPPS